MIRLGEIQELTVLRKTDFGVFLGEEPGDENAVLLPGKQVPEGTETGDRIRVFIYRDSRDRLIATTAEPKIHLGETAVLEVRQVTKIGAFLDMGLEKDLLLPYREQVYPVKEGDSCLVALYIDRSGRLAATMRVYRYLSADSPYQKDDRVTGRVYEISDAFGVYVAVDDRYCGLIRKSEVYRDFRPGEQVECRVLNVREDGKLDLTCRDKAYLQINQDAELVLRVIDEYAGALPFGENVRPEVIRREFGLSKAAFKRAVGHLLKQGKITISDTAIRRTARSGDDEK
jgi:predicted RNA-binding protein (virulence factor B family)